MIPVLFRTGLLILCTSMLLSEVRASVHAVEGKGGGVTHRESTLVPDRDIAYASEETPKWKALWDNARELSRQGLYDEALDEYLGLLDNKPNLDEARWEYISILLHLKQWQPAAEQFDILTAGGGMDTPEHLFAGAEIALQTGRAVQAGKMYSRLYVQFTAGEKGVSALDGLTRALIAQGKGTLALPLVEQLLLRRPDELSYQKRAGLLMVDAGKTERAVAVFKRILPNTQGDRRVLKAYAAALDGLGEHEAAAAVRQEYFAVDQSDQEVNRALAAYYNKKGNPGMELRHLEQLVDITHIDNEVYHRVAELNLSLGRIDRVLEVSSSILAVQPENIEFSILRERALNALAAEMLALAENGDTVLLWDDLQNITADRTEVFRIMAGMLREQHNTEGLYEILAVMSGELSATDPLRKEYDMLRERESGEGQPPHEAKAQARNNPGNSQE